MLVAPFAPGGVETGALLFLAPLRSGIMQEVAGSRRIRSSWRIMNVQVYKQDAATYMCDISSHKRPANAASMFWWR